MTESRNHGMTDRLKTVYPPKTSFCGGYKDTAAFCLYFYGNNTYAVDVSVYYRESKLMLYS